MYVYVYVRVYACVCVCICICICILQLERLVEAQQTLLIAVDSMPCKEKMNDPLTLLYSFRWNPHPALLQQTSFCLFQSPRNPRYRHAKPLRTDAAANANGLPRPQRKCGDPVTLWFKIGTRSLPATVARLSQNLTWYIMFTWVIVELAGTWHVDCQVYWKSHSLKMFCFLPFEQVKYKNGVVLDKVGELKFLVIRFFCYLDWFSHLILSLDLALSFNKASSSHNL